MRDETVRSCSCELQGASFLVAALMGQHWHSRGFSIRLCSTAVVASSWWRSALLYKHDAVSYISIHASAIAMDMEDRGPAGPICGMHDDVSAAFICFALKKRTACIIMHLFALHCLERSHSLYFFFFPTYSSVHKRIQLYKSNNFKFDQRITNIYIFKKI